MKPSLNPAARADVGMAPDTKIVANQAYLSMFQPPGSCHNATIMRADLGTGNLVRT